MMKQVHPAVPLLPPQGAGEARGGKDALRQGRGPHAHGVPGALRPTVRLVLRQCTFFFFDDRQTLIVTHSHHIIIMSWHFIVVLESRIRYYSVD